MTDEPHISKTLPNVCSFWYGDLSWLERLSITSFVAQGHEFFLYGYERPDNLPEGAIWVDATQIVSRDQMFFYKGNRSPAVFADWFRLLLMRKSAGIWVDCDMICLAPFVDLGPYVFAYGRKKSAWRTGKRGVNNAVFRCPAEAHLLDDLEAVFDWDEKDGSPPFLPPLRRLEVVLRKLFGRAPRLADMQFGATGPWPLQFYLNKHELLHHALSPETFYPVPYGRVHELLENETDIENLIEPTSLGVHLWHSALTNRDRGNKVDHPKPGSFLWKMCDQHNISLPDAN